MNNVHYFDIVVVGSGLSALYAVVEIGKKSSNYLRCALIADKSYSIFNPLVYDYIEGEIPLSFVSLSISDVCRRSGFEYIRSSCLRCDPNKNEIVILTGLRIGFTCLVLAAGRSRMKAHKLHSSINISRLLMADLHRLRNASIKNEPIKIIGAGNSGLEYHMKSKNANLSLDDISSISDNVIPSLKRRFLTSRPHHISGLSNSAPVLDVAAYPECVKHLYSYGARESCIVDCLHEVNAYLQTCFPNIFCIGDQAVLGNVPSFLRNTAQLAYQQRKVLASNVLSLFNNDNPRVQFKAFEWGAMYTYAVGKSEVSLFGNFVISGRVGHFIRYLVYWLRLPLLSLRVRVLKDFAACLLEYGRSATSC